MSNQDSETIENHQINTTISPKNRNVKLSLVEDIVGNLSNEEFYNGHETPFGYHGHNSYFPTPKADATDI